jgi:hypothetical protein
MKRQTLRVRFEAKYIPEPNSGCWLWTAACNQAGYGEISVGAERHGAHRISWELHRGKIPERMYVLHRCDNPSCVNPEHLFLGTQSDNAIDYWAKGRMNRHYGAKPNRSKLTDSLVRQICSDKTMTSREWSQKLGVRHTVVSRVRAGYRSHAT